MSIPFCTNWGFVLFDTIDHYLCTYLLVLVGILQCFGCGWGFDAGKTMSKSGNHSKSLGILTVSFWFWTVLSGCVFVPIEKTPYGILCFALGFLLFGAAPSMMVSKMGFVQWYNEIVMCGVRKIGYSISQLGRKKFDQREMWEPVFVFYWGFTIKYLIPVVLWFILVGSIKTDITSPYGGYAVGW